MWEILIMYLINYIVGFDIVHRLHFWYNGSVVSKKMI